MLLKHGDKLYYFTSSKQNLLFSSSWPRKRKGGFAWISSSLWSCRSPNFWSSQSYFPLCNHRGHPFIDEPMATTDLNPLYQAHGVYPSNMQQNIIRMLKNDLTRFRQTLLLVVWLFHRALIKQRYSRWHHLVISAGSVLVLEAKDCYFFRYTIERRKQCL